MPSITMFQGIKVNYTYFNIFLITLSVFFFFDSVYSYRFTTVMKEENLTNGQF